jgi:hypothetical protein
MFTRRHWSKAGVWYHFLLVVTRRRNDSPSLRYTNSGCLSFLSFSVLHLATAGCRIDGVRYDTCMLQQYHPRRISNYQNYRWKITSCRLRGYTLCAHRATLLRTRRFWLLFRFELQPEHRLSWLWVTLVPLGLQANARISSSVALFHSLSNSSFINDSTILSCMVLATEGVIK